MKLYTRFKAQYREEVTEFLNGIGAKNPVQVMIFDHAVYKALYKENFATINDSTYAIQLDEPQLVLFTLRFPGITMVKADDRI